MSKLISIVMLILFVLMSFNSYSNEYPPSYPFRPEIIENIYNKVKNFSEVENIEKNIYEIKKQRLNFSHVTSSPWSASYWPINKGKIAFAYPSSGTERLLDWTVRIPRSLSWTANMRKLQSSVEYLKVNWKNLNEEELELLSPAAKYDLLLGDETFDLTSRIVKNVFNWAKYENRNNLINKDHDKKIIEQIANQLVQEGTYADLSLAKEVATNIYIQEKDNYVLQRKDEFVPIWEGICHGWAPSSTVFARPEKFVDIKLKDGRNLRFFPEDIKALISYAWSNSNVGNSKSSNGSVILEGNICKHKFPKKDEWGRFYDLADKDFPLVPQYRCTGIHPAVWHLALVNVIGKQNRSFVADIDINATINNHPIYGYDMKFFNPYSGDEGSLESSIQNLTNKDQFKKFRLFETKKIVGVKLEVYFVNYDSPKREEYNSQKDDNFFSRTMFYDLEIDDVGNIIGGQWRTTKVGAKNLFGNRNMPDMMWIISNNWKSFFADKNLSKWNKKSIAPQDWKKEALKGHSLELISNNYTCVYKNEKTGDKYKIICNTLDNKPNLLSNVINGLLELSRR